MCIRDSGPPAAHRQVLGDPLLHVVQAGVVGVEHRTRAQDVVGVVGALVPRQFQHGVQPRADPADLGGLVGGALQLVHLGERGLADVLGQVGALDAGAVVLLLGGGLAVQLGQLLADRGQLLAQQELPLLLLHALLDVLADRLGDVQLRQVLATPHEQLLQPRVDVVGLQQPDLLLLGHVGGVTGEVGQRGRLVDLLHGVHDLPRPALLQDRGHQRAVLAGQLVGVLVGRRGVGHGRLDPQRRAGAGRAGADAHALRAADDGRALTAGQPADLLDQGQGAHLGVLAVQSGDQQDPRLGTGLGGGGGGLDGGTGLGVRVRTGKPDGDDHAGEHDHVVEGQHRKSQSLAHQFTLQS